MTDTRTGTYVVRRRVDAEPEDADRLVRDALAGAGFGVLTEIDVHAVLKAKLGVEVPFQRILGACNPQLAHRALEIEPDLGALLPCNVVVRAAGTGTEVVAVDPGAMLGVTGNPALEPLAAEVRRRLEDALDRISPRGS